MLVCDNRKQAVGINYAGSQSCWFYWYICQKLQLSWPVCSCLAGTPAYGPITRRKRYSAVSSGSVASEEAPVTSCRERLWEAARYRHATEHSWGALTGQLYFISEGLIAPASTFPRGARVQRAHPTGGHVANAFSSWEWWLGSSTAGLWVGEQGRQHTAGSDSFPGWPLSWEGGSWRFNDLWAWL